MDRERHAFAYQVAEGKFNDFRGMLGELWPQITKLLDGIGAFNFSLWQIQDLVFGYYETDGLPLLSEEKERAAAALISAAQKYGRWISAPDQEMRLMYEDFGIVREDKSLIRHRVFATQLKGDHQEEYKRRHDALIEARGGKVTPGPDSNFSIWNAERYIFGYDEIDVTMEQAQTEESKEDTIAWETKMLEIMDWFTDDVDWITGMHHPHIQRIGHHG